MKIAIIGGTGKMGRWLAEFLLKDGKQVIITGRDPSRLAEVKARLNVETASIIEAARLADVIIVSVPIEGFEPVIKEIAPNLHQGQLVIDVSSVKTMPVDLMHQYIKSATVLGCHPLFGPGARDLTGQNVVLTPTSPAEEAQARKIESYLIGKGATVTFMTPQEHDEIMSAVLGLSHFIGLVAADTLSGTGKLAKMIGVGGTTFKLLLTLAESVLSEDPALYASLQMNLPGVKDIEGRFQESARLWARLVEAGDRDGFIARMTSLRQELERTDPALREAYQRMYRINEALRRPEL